MLNICAGFRDFKDGKNENERLESQDNTNSSDNQNISNRQSSSIQLAKAASQNINMFKPLEKAYDSPHKMIHKKPQSAYDDY